MVSKGVSTWSLHRMLEGFSVPAPGDDPSAAHERNAEGIPLLDLPAELASRGYETLQVCHFHIPRRDPDYFEQLRVALDDANIELDALLIDAGDLTHPTDAGRHQRWIEGWVDDAITLGATNARIIAGKQTPTPETLNESARRLEAIADARDRIRILTENWGDLLCTPEAVESLFDLTHESVGLLLDLGNWSGESKYDDLRRVAELAERTHAKCAFDASGAEETDYTRSLQILRDVGYEQTVTLIYDGPYDDEWAGLETEWNIVQEVFASR
jgi:sugar phosphate isomerase/epimerase